MIAAPFYIEIIGLPKSKLPLLVIVLLKIMAKLFYTKIMPPVLSESKPLKQFSYTILFLITNLEVKLDSYSYSNLLSFYIVIVALIV